MSIEEFLSSNGPRFHFDTTYDIETLRQWAKLHNRPFAQEPIAGQEVPMRLLHALGLAHGRPVCKIQLNMEADEPVTLTVEYTISALDLLDLADTIEKFVLVKRETAE